MNALKNNKINNSNLGKTLEKLSSGYKINRAADDAAGLAVSEKMRSQLAGIHRAVRNAEDGVSYVQTAEGALNEIHSLLHRQRDLAVQAANGSYDNEIDRQAIQEEFSRLTEEVDQISCTDFNGIYVFDNTGANVKPAFPENVSGAVVRTSALDGTTQTFVVNYGLISGISTGISKGFTQAALENYAGKLKDTYIPKMLGGIVSSLPNSMKPTVNGMTIGFEFVYEDTSTLAFVANRYSAGNPVSQELNLSVNLKFLTQTGSSINMTPDMNTTIAHEMTHAVMNDILTAGMVGQGVDPFPDWFIEGTAQSVGGAMNYVDKIVPWTVRNNTEIPPGYAGAGTKLETDDRIMAGLGLSQLTDTDISAYLHELTTNPGRDLMPYEQGYLASMYLGWLEGGKGAVTQQTIAKGLDSTFVRIRNNESLEDVIQSHGFASLSDFEKKFGDADSVNFVKALVAATGVKKYVDGNVSVVTDPNGNQSFKVSTSFSTKLYGGTGSIISPNGLSGDKASLMNISTTSSFFTLDPDTVYGTDLVGDLNVPGDKIFEGGGATLPDNGSVTPPDPGGGTDPADPTDPGGGTTPGGGTADPSDPGGDTPSGGGDILTGHTSLILQLGAHSKDAVEFTFKYDCNAIGYLKSDMNCTAQGLGLNKLAVNVQERANDAIDKLDWAINKVSLIRDTFGAIQNRLEHKIDNLNNLAENLTAAESTVRDTDIAEEMMRFTKEQILSQASQSMLAQANAVPQQILNLLGP